jgi:cytochrome c
MKNLITLFLSLFVLILVGCNGSPKNEAERSAPASTANVDPMTTKGIGPIKNMTLAAIDENMVAEGKQIFDNMCSACHKPDKRFIGPAPKDILERRTPEWVMNMILNPEEMVQKDPVARQLLIEYNGAPMANQNLTEDQARKILEYFRTL